MNLMSEDFAITCAEILPVLALALLATLEAVRRTVNKAITRLSKKREYEQVPTIAIGVLWFIVWAWLMFRIVDAEKLCISRVQGAHVTANAAESVSATLHAGMVLLFVIPVLGVAASWIAAAYENLRHDHAESKPPDTTTDVTTTPAPSD
jgi:hypothetical protein